MKKPIDPLEELPSPQGEKLSEITECVKMLNTRCDTLDKQIYRLMKKLEPVVPATELEVVGTKREPSAETSLGLELVKVSIRMDMMISTFDLLLDEIRL